MEVIKTLTTLGGAGTGVSQVPDGINKPALYLTALFALVFYALDAFFSRGPVSKWLYQILSNNAKLEEKKRKLVTKQAASRLIGAIHNAVQVPIALYVISHEIDNMIISRSKVGEIMTAFSAGFFLYDGLHCLLHFKEEGWQFAVHGVSCFCVYFCILYTNFCIGFAAGFLLWECSTPFIHLRWFMAKAGYDKTQIYLWNGVAAFTIFFFCRILWGTYLTYLFFKFSGHLLVNPQYAIWTYQLWMFRFFCVLLNGLNHFWFYKMCKLIAHLLKEGSQGIHTMNEGKID